MEAVERDTSADNTSSSTLSVMSTDMHQQVSLPEATERPSSTEVTAQPHTSFQSKHIVPFTQIYACIVN